MNFIPETNAKYRQMKGTYVHKLLAFAEQCSMKEDGGGHKLGRNLNWKTSDIVAQKL